MIWPGLPLATWVAVHFPREDSLWRYAEPRELWDECSVRPFPFSPPDLRTLPNLISQFRKYFHLPGILVQKVCVPTEGSFGILVINLTLS